MKPRLLAVLLLIVLVPLGLLAWFAARVARDEQEAVGRRFQRMVSSNLETMRDSVRQLVDRRFHDLAARLANTGCTPDDLRDVARRSALVTVAFCVGDDGHLVFPTTATPPAAGRDSLPRSHPRHLVVEAALHTGRDHRHNGFLVPANPDRCRRRMAPVVLGQHPPLLYWRRDPSGRVVGAEVNGMRLLADVIALLPGTDPLHPDPPDARIALLDADGTPLYQWGAADHATSTPRAVPTASVALDYPLNSWHLAYYPVGNPAASLRTGQAFGMILGLAALGLALAALAAHFYRESSRELREAAQRVSFVNQVSHELKTPLTNIRMYAELLDNDLGEEDAAARRRLDVIVSESQRLSRLIGNILTFSRQQRHTLNLHTVPGAWMTPSAIRSDHFRPSLESSRVTIAFDGGAGAPVMFDADALGQILGNLFGNVEKYAAAGGQLRVASRQDRERQPSRYPTTARNPRPCAGKGVCAVCPSPRPRERGRGRNGHRLAIARDLARLHGGDLRVVDGAGSGATFELTIATPAAPEEKEKRA